MSIQTDAELQTATVEKLQDLIQTNIDSVKGFRESADDIRDESLASLFESIARERSMLADELQQIVASVGENPQSSGSVSASIHQTWLNIRAKLSGGDPGAILAEAERGEDVIKGLYEDVLKETAGSPVNALLQSQYATVKHGHDRIRDLRDAYQKKT